MKIATVKSRTTVPAPVVNNSRRVLATLFTSDLYDITEAEHGYLICGRDTDKQVFVPYGNVEYAEGTHEVLHDTAMPSMVKPTLKSKKVSK